MRDKNSPTEKQIEFVERITKTLHINFPNSSKDFTKYQYSLFISANIEEYKEAIQEGHCYNDEEYLNWISTYENDVWCEHY